LLHHIPEFCLLNSKLGISPCYDSSTNSPRSSRLLDASLLKMKIRRGYRGC
jgi:hypothetical protein